MRGDFSRASFDPTKHYDAVLMQQGRVQLDADWNEQVEIERHRREIGTRDLVGSHGVPVDNPGFAITPRVALDFDGRDDYVVIVDGGSLATADLSSFTFETWVNPRQDAPGGTIVSSVREFVPGEWLLGVELDGRLTYKQVVAAPTASQLAADDPDASAMSNLLSDVALPFGTFTHVALTVDPTGAALYIGGALAGRAAAPAALASAHRPFVLGAMLRRGVTSRLFGGQMQGIRLWSAARPSDEIERDSRQALVGDEPGLILYWPVDPPDGDVTRDLTGNGNDGQLGGGSLERRPSWVLRDLGIGRGRLYVDGLLVENERKRWLAYQPDLPGSVLPPRTAERERYVVYADVWRRHLSHLEEPSIREVALGGPDTTTRSRVVWQVKVLPLPAASGDDWLLDWYGWTAQAERAGTLRARRDPSAPPGLGNQLYRVELHDADDGGRPAVGAEVLPGEGRQLRLERWDVDGRTWRVGEAVELLDAAVAGRARRAVTTEIVAADEVSRTVTLAAPAGDLTSPHLRRVATFKWSRENGSIVFGVVQADAASGLVTLHDLGRDDYALAEGDWVELVDDTTTLQGRTSPLSQVVAVDRARKTVRLSRLPEGVGQAPEAHPLLRRWDQPGDDGAATLSSGTVPVQQGWIALEDGVQVLFGGDGPYRAGDYWLIPARSLGDTVEWPQDAAGPVALPPHGVRHHRAPLAIVTLDGERATVEDCRRFFEPLTAMGGRESAYLRRTGDTVAGSFGVDGAVTVGGDMMVRGTISAGSIDAPIRTGAVGEEQILDGAVSPAKLAPDAGIVPPGFAILGDTVDAPPGFVYTGASVTAHNPGWRRVVALAERADASVAVADGVLYVFAESGEVWSYDPASDALRKRAALTPRRRGFAAGSVDGRLFVVGGVDPSGRPVDAVAEYEPGTDRWSERAPMPTPRAHLALAAIGGRLYAVGGEAMGRFGSTPTGASEAYDPRTNTWVPRAALPTPRSGLALASAAGKLYAIGGERRGALPGMAATLASVNEEYDPAADRWRRRASLRHPRSGLGAVGQDDRVVVIGGERTLRAHREGARGSRLHEQYDPGTGEWLDLDPLPSSRGRCGVALVAGAIYSVSAHADRLELAIELVSQTLYVHRKAPASGSSPTSPYPGVSATGLSLGSSLRAGTPGPA
jgi:hypothetical protein